MIRRTPMQVSIETILAAYGHLDNFRQADHFHLRITQELYMPLVIEKHGDRVAVAHTYIQNGDIMRDPEIVFALPTWEPVEITQDPVGIHHTKYITRRGRVLVHVNFHRQVQPLVRLWAANLKAQNYARGYSHSLTHFHTDNLKEPGYKEAA